MDAVRRRNGSFEEIEKNERASIIRASAKISHRRSALSRACQRRREEVSEAHEINFPGRDCHG